MILLTSMCLLSQTEIKVQIQPGDHVYILNDNASHPTHFQLTDETKDVIIKKYLAISEEAAPNCEIFFDPTNYRTVTLRKGKDGTLYVEAMSSKLNKSVAVNTDPESQPLFIDGRVVFTKDRYLTINTPQLSHATSFKICTNNRVFVFVKQPVSLTAKKL